MLSPQGRLLVFFLRLNGLHPAASASEALQQIHDTLNSVEDEFTSIPFDPSAWETTGRLYPPQEDSARGIEGNERVTRYRSFNHNTFIGDNGSIEVRKINPPEIVFEKAGADGKGVWAQDDE